MLKTNIKFSHSYQLSLFTFRNGASKLLKVGTTYLCVSFLSVCAFCCSNFWN